MSLTSKAYIQIADLICEGPIEGLVGNRRAVFLDETPLETADASGNIEVSVARKYATLEFNKGTRDQEALDNQGYVKNLVDVAQEVGKNYEETLDSDDTEVRSRDYGAGDVVRQITDTSVEAFQCVLTIPRLFSTAMEGLARGQLFGARLKIKFFVQAVGSGGGFTELKEQVINVRGISTTNYQIKTDVIALSGTGPWNIKVRKADLKEAFFVVSKDDFQDISKKTPLANGRGNQLVWTSLVEVKKHKPTYPYTAVAGLKLATEFFPRLPTRAYLIRGMQVQIPSNATVRTGTDHADGSLDFDPNREFTGGLTDGQWTTCPVCCWYDMLVKSRYGAGDFVDAANLSWVDLYPLAQYANQLVEVKTTNGETIQEPRFACNTIISSPQEAFKVLQDLASVFRGMLYWQTNVIQASADHGNLDGSAVAPVHLYTNSNVIGGGFEYSGSSLKTRSTCVRVRYNDPENFYKSNFVVVEDRALIDKYGHQIKEITAFACTSQHQAQRMGRWLLAVEELNGKTVTFVTGLQGAVVAPGQVFAVQDELRAGSRLAGRVSAATTTDIDGTTHSLITGDQAITLPSGDNAQLTCTLPDGTVETRAITNVNGAVMTTAVFSTAPLLQSIYSIKTDTVVEQKFRCLSVADNGDGTYAVVGVEHNDSIYATADTGAELAFDDVTVLNEDIDAPTNVNFARTDISIGGTTANRLQVSWDSSSEGVIGFDVRYTVGNGEEINGSSTQTLFNIDGVAANTNIEFEVRAVGAGGIKRSNWTEAQHTTSDANIDSSTGGIILPVDPEDVSIQVVGEDAVLRWKVPQSTLIKTSTLTAVIRHSALTDGTGVWANSTLLRSVAASTSFANLPLIEGEYLIKFQDEAGQRSANAAGAVISLPDDLPKLLVENRIEDQDTPEFQGDRDGVFYSDTYDGLVLDGDAKIDAITVEIDDPSISSFDFFGTRLLEGRYFFKSVLDLGAKFSVLFKRRLRTNGIYPASTLDDRAELLDRWSDFDGDVPDDTSAQIYFRSSDQAPADADALTEDSDNLLLEDGNKIEMESDIDFGDWVPMESGRFAGRQFQFKCELSSTHVDETPVVSQLGYQLQMSRRTESATTQASGAGAKAVTFTNAFYQTPSIGITASNLASGDYYEVTSATRSGFTVTFRNSSNAAVDRNFSYQATGFGSETT
tara:strand:+ start:870 stop:4379 length:3510 start_codon:yes stop_codon:yes gene_type:complete